MIELFLTIFCLFVSFVFSSKKMKIKSIVQVILSVVLTFIVLFLLPNAPLASFLEQKLGDGTLAVLQDVLINIERYGISIIKIITYAVIFLTLLSIFDIVEYVQEKTKQSKTEKIVLKEKKYRVKDKFIFIENKVYLLFCRLLD